MADDELQKFLEDIGFTIVLNRLRDNHITTMKALKYCDAETLESIGCSPFAALTIVKELNNKQSSSTGPSIHEKNEQEQILVKKDEFQNRVDELMIKLMIMEKEKKAKLAATPPSPSVVIPWNDPIYQPWTRLFPFAFPDSTLLTLPFSGMIQAWLGSPRQLVLRYRGSRNGFSTSQFHALCNNVGPTVTIVKSGGYLFGGYNPFSWTSAHNFKSGDGSFIFTLVNPYGTPPLVFHFKSGHGPYDHSGHGPTWGAGHDLYISNACNGNNISYTNFPHSYNDALGYGNNIFTGAKNFTVADIEVFSV